ncbi:MAG TPA: PilX N-terminal domain-containing pilus assembly protein [Steroidobacteraceae bacterium]|jgi:type IV pilus assembly protein PilX|nr:PilX N-terminal domain-containing pilus assembly protein [Steroidobacteraceae bacterium]
MPFPRKSTQLGMVLITTMLLLVVVTILALAMFRGAGLEERIAGNTMEKQRALQAAVSAQQYGEQWLATNITSSAAVDCSGQASSSSSAPTICSNILANSLDSGTVGNVPWSIGGNAAGYSYDPVNAATSTNYFPINTGGGLNTYYAAPVMYISQLGIDATLSNAVDYRVDAWSYAGAQSTVAVVESTYQVRFTSKAPGP